MIHTKLCQKNKSKKKKKNYSIIVFIIFLFLSISTILYVSHYFLLYIYIYICLNLFLVYEILNECDLNFQIFKKIFCSLKFKKIQYLFVSFYLNLELKKEKVLKRISDYNILRPKLNLL